MGFTALNTIDDQFCLYTADSGALKNVVLLRLILNGRVVVSKRAILAIRGVNGSGGPGFTGLLVLQGKVI